MSIGRHPDISLAEARNKATRLYLHITAGEDPIAIKQEKSEPSITSVDELFDDWYTTDLSRRIKHVKIPLRIYVREIQPHIGQMPVADVKPPMIRKIIKKAADSGRPTTANDTLAYLKQLFRHALKLGLIDLNPASPFTGTDAGGVEQSRDRVLTPKEIEHAFSVFRQHISSFGAENYLACCLLLVLGVRKSELCQARWEEFNLAGAIWNLSQERSKTGAAITIPLPTQAIAWLKTLEARSCGSDYVFPARRASKTPHMGSDTLNRAITKLFGHEAGRKQQPPNLMGKLEHFTLHDLRRTFRSLAASQGVPGHVAERCLNHKLKGVEGIYDRYDYFEERKAAHQKVADAVETFLEF